MVKTFSAKMQKQKLKLCSKHVIFSPSLVSSHCFSIADIKQKNSMMVLTYQVDKWPSASKNLTKYHLSCINSEVCGCQHSPRVPSLPWKQHSYFKIIQLLDVDYWHESFQSMLIDSLWSGQMRHGKCFKLVHLSCWGMGRDWDFFMLIGKKKQRNRESKGGKGESRRHTKKKAEWKERKKWK